MSDLERFVLDDTVYWTRRTRKFETRKPYMPSDPRRVHAAIPGVIVQIQVKAGQKVRRGDSLLVLEAMKMKNDVTAQRDGEIMTVSVSPGQMVAKGQVLIEYTA